MPDLAHALYLEVLERPGEPPLEGEVALATLRRQPDGAWRLVVRDWHGLQGGGSSFAVLPDEFPDLWGDEPPGDGGPHGGAPPSAVEPAA